MNLPNRINDPVVWTNKNITSSAIDRSIRIIGRGNHLRDYHRRKQRWTAGVSRCPPRESILGNRGIRKKGEDRRKRKEKETEGGFCPTGPFLLLDLNMGISCGHSPRLLVIARNFFFPHGNRSNRFRVY